MRDLLRLVKIAKMWAAIFLAARVVFLLSWVALVLVVICGDGGHFAIEWSF